MGVSERTVRRWIKAGRLKAYKPGRDYRIPEAGLRVFIEESEISPKDPAPLQLELEEQGGANTLVLGAEPHYNAFEAFGRILASSWKDELEEWDKKIPAETTPNLFDTGRLLEWVVGIGGTKRTYETIAVDTYDPPRTELQDTLRLMDEAYGEALQKCLKVLRPAKEYAEFRKIVEENDLEAILSNAAGDE
jgi:excisionase family DNA binding protein